jgi:hypothetical protein
VATLGKWEKIKIICKRIAQKMENSTTFKNKIIILQNIIPQSKFA